MCGRRRVPCVCYCGGLEATVVLDGIECMEGTGIVLESGVLELVATRGPAAGHGRGADGCRLACLRCVSGAQVAQSSTVWDIWGCGREEQLVGGSSKCAWGGGTVALKPKWCANRV